MWSVCGASTRCTCGTCLLSHATRHSHVPAFQHAAAVQSACWPEAGVGLCKLCNKQGIALLIEKRRSGVHEMACQHAEVDMQRCTATDMLHGAAAGGL